MSKELKALEKLRQYWKNDIPLGINQGLRIVSTLENGFKRLEEHDKLFKKYDINDIWLEPSLFVIKNHFPMDTETQLNKLKALDIIKKKRVDVGWFIECLSCVNPLEVYNDRYDKIRSCDGKNYHFMKLNQEEFDSVKKVLLCK